MARVKEIWRYPVKSMIGERIEETALGERGVTGDRAWIIRDEKSGAICGAKKIGGLMKLAAAYSEPPTADGSRPARIKFEDGSVANSTDGDINERLSAALGRNVTLWPLVRPADKEHYKREVSISAMSDAELRGLFAREDNEPIPDLSAFPTELLDYESPIGTYFDAFPILILSTRSLESMQERAPESCFDVRRFRPNILLDEVDSEDPFPELAWAGKRAQIGGAIVKLAMACPRCVMVTREFQDLSRDPDVMRALVRETKGDLGIGATIEKPGSIREQDAFALLD